MPENRITLESSKIRPGLGGRGTQGGINHADRTVQPAPKVLREEVADGTEGWDRFGRTDLPSKARIGTRRQGEIFFDEAEPNLTVGRSGNFLFRIIGILHRKFHV